MKKATVKITGNSVLTFSKFYEDPKKSKEKPEDYEERTWRERLHYNDDGYVIIPPMTFIKALQSTVSGLGMKIPGRKNATYTKHFLSGIMLLDPLVLNIKKEDVKGKWVYVPSDGKRGGGSRVKKCFPEIPPGQWGGTQEYIILNDIITRDVFEAVIKEAGVFNGILSYRPQNGGLSGRFLADIIKWEESEM